jgi:hypothetical protein
VDNELKQQAREFVAILVKAADNGRLMRAMALTMSATVLPQEHFQDDIVTLYRHLNSFVLWIDELQRNLLPKCEIDAVDKDHVLH